MIYKIFKTNNFRIQLDPPKTHPDRCVLCDQHDESIDHILVASPKSRQLWWLALSAVGQQRCLQMNESYFYLWLCDSRKKVDKRTWPEVAKAMVAEATLRHLAGTLVPVLGP
uniref:Reverse transcriptase zinc-binding domain-containing protein n=1 Tax=Oryza glumipatula TaxID=40148 RepID=A0A0E0A6E4_9ORYZ